MTTSADEQSAVQRVYLEVADRLANGELRPGQWLRERTLAQSLGISRTPVREALNKFAAEGLVRLERNRGAQVVEWTREQILEIYGLRSATEAFVASVAAKKIDDETLAKLEDNLSQYERVIELGDATRGRLFELNNEFHSLIISATNNDTLIYLASGVINLPLARRTFLRYTDRDLKRSAAQHRELVEVLRDGDSEATSMLMHVHNMTAQRALLKSEQFPESGDAESPAD
jgi:DNA-binding GntR family transcriptional regulator